MELISYDSFQRLRLSDFYKSSDVEEVSGYEFMDDIWIGETIGFNEFLRLEEDNQNTKAIILNFTDPSISFQSQVLDKIGLAIAPGMTIDKIISIIGSP